MYDAVLAVNAGLNEGVRRRVRECETGSAAKPDAVLRGVRKTARTNKLLGKPSMLLLSLKNVNSIITKQVFLGRPEARPNWGHPERPSGRTKSTIRQAPYQLGPEPPCAVDRRSFRPAFTVKTASFNKSLSVRRPSVLGERYIRRRPATKTVRRRMIWKMVGAGPPVRCATTTSKN